jgi:hypothetical protein
MELLQAWARIRRRFFCEVVVLALAQFTATRDYLQLRRVVANGPDLREQLLAVFKVLAKEEDQKAVWRWIFSLFLSRKKVVATPSNDISDTGDEGKTREPITR